MMVRLVLFLACVTTALVLPATSASAKVCSGGTIENGVVVGCEDEDSSETPADGGGGGTLYQPPQPYKDYYLTPSCSLNGPPPDDPNNSCTGFKSKCQADDEYSYFVYSRQMTAEGEVADDAEWELEGSQCRGSDDPPLGGPPVITTAMVADAAREAAPDSAVAVEPADRSYVNVPTNFSTGDDTVDATVTVLGIVIPLEFTPTDVTWAFGDGSSDTGAGIANASVGQIGAVEHEYRRQGDYSVTVTRSFTVRATLPNGAVDLPGLIDSTSEPYPLDIGEIQSTVTELR